MLKSLGLVLRIFLVYMVLSVACFLMLRTIFGYASFRDDVQFLQFKQPYIHNTVWKTSFYIHVFSAIIALFAGFTQFSSQFLKDHRLMHRLLGRIYVVDILVINFPAAMIMGIYANGEAVGKTAFILLDCLWFLFTWKAYSSARGRNFASHKDYMMRSYALTFSAITLRAWKLILSHSFVIDPMELYKIDAWMGFLPNLMVAEWMIRSRRPRNREPIAQMPSG